MCRILFCTFFILSLICSHVIAGDKLNSRTWQRTLTLDKEAGITILWNITEQGQKWIDMQVTAPTRGYIGLGFSSNGAMRGSDIVLLWVDDTGRGHVKDLYGTGNEQPKLDLVQNYKLIQAEESPEGTKIWFRRPLVTCDDKEDMDLTAETMRLIWATGETDPVMTSDNLSFNYHGVNQRGVKSVFLLDNPIRAPFPDDPSLDNTKVKYWDLTMKDNQVNQEETTYFCKIVKFPYKEKHHMIGYRPMITPKNIKRVHHICMYECIVPKEAGGTESVFENHTSHNGGRCYTPSMPPEWTQYCMTFLVCWVVGSDGELLPEHMGSPMGEEHNGATYFMLELHYHNPEKLVFKDSSGIRLFLDEPRQYDGNLLLINHRVTPFQLIPPHQEKFQSFGICTSECTQATFPPDGIKIVSVLLHTHLAGRGIRVRHFRNGVELPRIAEDDAYDANYQQTRVLRNEVVVLPGDDIVTECDYTTVDKNTSVLGGLSATQEMCVSFLQYYPKTELSYCSSQSEFYDFFDGLGIQNVTSKVFPAMNLPYNPYLWSKEKQRWDPPDNARELESIGDGQSFVDIFDLMSIDKPDNLKNLTVSKYLRQIDWKDQKVSKNVENKWKNGKFYAYCTGHGRRRVPLKNYIVNYPKIDQPYVSEPHHLCLNHPAQLESSSESTNGGSLGFELKLNIKILSLISILMAISYSF